MPGTEELLARLKSLEDGYYGDKEAARQKRFFDTYGARFSNNRGLGLAILNELDARGIDTSAADEAVQEILDTLRTECNEIIESIKDVQQQAIENAQKVETVANVVSEAVAANPEAAGEVDTSAIDQSMPDMTVPPDSGLDSMDPNGEFNPDEVPPEEQMAAEGDEMPPEESPAEGNEVPPEEPPVPDPNQVTSDIRMKRVQRMKDAWGKTRAQRKKGSEQPQDKPPAQNSYKPSAGILSAAQGGR